MTAGRPVIYVANMRLPSEKAHSVHVMEMCAALTARDRQVHLLVPDRAALSGVDTFSYYGIDRARASRITIHRLFTIDLVGRGLTHPIGFYLQTALFGWSVLWRVRQWPEAPVVARDFLSAVLLAFAGRRVAYEVHDLPRLWTAVFLRRIPLLITTNTWKRDALVHEFRIPSDRITVLPNAVDVERFQKAVAAPLREQLGIPFHARLIVYTGHLFAWKGVETLVRAARVLQQAQYEVCVVVVGGTEADQARLAVRVRSEEVGNTVRIVGHRPHADMPGILAAADVLVLPTSGKPGLGVHETSPIKAFEYLAAGKPIVASDVPTSHDVLSPDTAIFFRPDDAADCARAIQAALGLSGDARSAMQERQLARVANATWQARSGRVLALFE